jgi:hypothetical protein
MEEVDADGEESGVNEREDQAQGEVHLVPESSGWWVD